MKAEIEANTNCRVEMTVCDVADEAAVDDLMNVMETEHVALTSWSTAQVSPSRPPPCRKRLPRSGRRCSALMCSRLT